MFLPDLHIGKEILLNLFQYYDYVDFIRDYCELCKQKNKRYSLRYFSKRLGIQSSGYIQFILKRERHLSDTVLYQMGQMMGLTSDEAHYLELLVKLKKVEKDYPRHKQCYERLQQIRIKKLKFKTVEEKQCELMSSWLHLVIREMTFLQGASLNVQWFRKCLNQTFETHAGEISRCLDDLKEAQMLMEKEGILTAVDPVIGFADHLMPEQLKQYHQEALENAIQGLANPAKDREYGAVLVASTRKKFQAFKEKLQQERRDHIAFLDTPAGESDMIVSFSFQLLPVAEIPNPSPQLISGKK